MVFDIDGALSDESSGILPSGRAGNPVRVIVVALISCRAEHGITSAIDFFVEKKKKGTDLNLNTEVRI
jgi:hypothetical protein